MGPSGRAGRARAGWWDPSSRSSFFVLRPFVRSMYRVGMSVQCRW